ncbi:MAG: iron ABC transporter permease [Nitriliruptoraceae bacterium]
MTRTHGSPLMIRTSLVLRRRSRLIVAALVIAVPLVGLYALTLGSSDLSLGETAAGVLGIGESGTTFVVRGLRLPRILVAIAAGAALGASGFLLQGLLRNPLGSPDVMGVTAGASLAAVLAIGAELAPFLLPLAAAAGAGIATATLHLLTTRSRAAGARLILAGIGIHAAASAATVLTVARLPFGRLGAAEVWLAGSLHARTWAHVVAVTVAVAVTLPVAYALVRRLGLLELGEDVAIGAGVPVRATRVELLVIATILAGAAVAVTGPVGFVALGAPHIARRIVGQSGAATLATAGLVGAILLLVADVIGQRVFHPTPIAAGVVTAVLGAPYLLWLLHRWGRR